MWDDRTLAMQPKSEVVAVCGDPVEPYVNEIQCNCSASGDWSISEEDPTFKYIGRMGTYLPYVRVSFVQIVIHLSWLQILSEFRRGVSLSVQFVMQVPVKLLPFFEFGNHVKFNLSCISVSVAS